MKPSIGLLVCLSVLPVPAWAFQPLVTDDTGTQGAGGNQIEAAYNRTRDKAAGARTITHEVPLVYTRGLTDTLDLYVAVGRQKISPDAPGAVESGWGNTALGAKWRFYDNEPNKLSFALKPEIQVPVSKNREARGLGTARTSYALSVIMTQETAFGAVHANLAAERVNYSDPVLEGAERRTRYRLSAAPVWDLTEQWKLALDAGILTNADRGARARMAYVEIGAIYSPDKNLDLALGVIRSLRDGDASSIQGTAGVTWRFR